MKKGKVIIIIVLVVLLVIASIITILSMKSEKTIKSRISNICDNITANENSKKSSIIFIENLNSTEESLDTVDKLKANYKNSNIYVVYKDDLKNKCLQSLLARNNVYEEISKINDSLVLIYNSGFKSMMVGLDSYKNVENYLLENKVISKKTLKEEISFEEYKDKFNSENYLLLIVDNENRRNKSEKLIKKYFKDYPYDIINLNSKIGQKIRENVENEHKALNEYPRIYYFKKGKLVKSNDMANEGDIKNFKNEILSKQN